MRKLRLLVTILFIVILSLSSHAQESTDSIYNMAEIMPRFPGGANAMNQYIAENIVYPDSAVGQGVKGNVYISFIVEKDGSLSDIKEARPQDKYLIKEAIRMASTMPKWEPGYNGENAVRVRVTILIKYIHTKDAHDGDMTADKKSEKIYGANGVLTDVAEMPRFPGGEKALKKYLLKGMNIDSMGIVAEVQLSFVIDIDGSVTDINVLNEVNPKYKEKAISLIKNMPKWEPGKNTKNEYVKVAQNRTIEIFDKIGKMPEFPGGLKRLRKYLTDSVKYPKKAQVNGFQDRVFVSFTIDKAGFVTDIQITKGIYHDLNIEAVRIVSSMPQWSPGLNEEGEPIKVRFTVPVNFMLKEAKKDNKERYDFTR